MSSVADILEELKKDPEFAKEYEKAKAGFEYMRKNLSKDDFQNWIAEHFLPITR